MNDTDNIKEENQENYSLEQIQQALDALVQEGYAVKELTLDRGYVYKIPELN